MDVQGQGRRDHRRGRRHRPERSAAISATKGAAIAAHRQEPRRSTTSPTTLEPAKASRSTPPIADISDAKAVAAAFAGIRRRASAPVDILVNNAGFSEHPTFAKTDPAGLGDDVNGNLNGAYNCAHAVLPGMKAKRCRLIIDIGSVNGSGRSAIPPTAPPRPE